MAGVYFQVRTEQVSDAVQCGLKLSEHADRELVLPGQTQPRRVMTAWLHPADLPDRGTAHGHTCLRLEVDPARCFVGDGDLYRMGQRHPELAAQHQASMVALQQYRFGTFRAPECAIPFSVLDTQIAVLGRSLDVPVLYESSEALYLQRLMNAYEEARQDGGNALFFAWCRLLESKGLMTRFPDDSGNREVYLSGETGATLVLNVPDRADGEVWP
jgi:hypothetical protein